MVDVTIGCVSTEARLLLLISLINWLARVWVASTDSEVLEFANFSTMTLKAGTEFKTKLVASTELSSSIRMKL